MKRIIALALITIMTSCSLKVGVLNPSPNINIGKTGKSMALVIDRSIGDVFTVPKQNGIKPANVTGFHTTLRNGFKNGFGDAFKIVEDAKKADFVLKLSKADIEFAPAAVSGQYGVVAIRSQVTFKATIVDGTGKDISRSANTAVSKKSTNKPSQSGSVLESAVESMYEIIGSEMKM